MKYTVALLFALLVIGSFGTEQAHAKGHAHGNGHADAKGCANHPNAISSLRIGNLAEGLVHLISQIVAQLLTLPYQLSIPSTTTVPVKAILSEFSASSCHTLRCFLDIVIRSLNLDLKKPCAVLNLMPLQIQNLQANAADLTKFMKSKIQARARPGSPVHLSEWSQWVNEFWAKKAASDIVRIFNTITAI